MNYEVPNSKEKELTPLEAVIKEAIFRGREELKILREKIKFNECKIFTRTIKQKGEPDFYQVVLVLPDGEDVVFALREEEKILVTDFVRDRGVTDEQIKIIKSAAATEIIDYN